MIIKYNDIGGWQRLGRGGAWLLLGAGALLLLTLMPAGGQAFSLREWLGLDQGEEPGQPGETAIPAAQPDADADLAPSGAGVQIDYERLAALMAVMNPQARGLLLGNRSAFQRFVHRELADQAVVQVALSEQRQNEPEAAFQIRRQAREALRSYYLDSFVAARLPPDYPSEEEMKEYYQDEPKRFSIGRRLHLWQVFFPLEAQATEAEEQEVRQQAQQVLQSLRTGALDFSMAVELYSQHQESRLQAGYLGLLAVDELNPAFREPVPVLKEGELSELIRDAGGFHIVRRGATVPAQSLSFEQVRGQIRQHLRTMRREQLQQQLYQQAAQVFPYSVHAETLEQWWVRLREAAGLSGQQAGAAVAQPPAAQAE